MQVRAREQIPERFHETETCSSNRQRAERQAGEGEQAAVDFTCSKTSHLRKIGPQEQGRAEWPHRLIPRNIIQSSIPDPAAQGCPCIQANSAEVSALYLEVQGRELSHGRWSCYPMVELGSWSISCTAIQFHLKIRLCNACRGMSHAERPSVHRAGTPSMQRPRGN